MSQTVIKVENLSKQYRLGTVGTGTLSHDLNRWWHKVRGKEDPYLKIGESNDRASKGESEYVWALKDINFEVKQGEVLGIIGKNGAGKSTLLKILSKVTGPTTGSIKAKGRIASLLEVGTGFHPELTGRENIYLNGTILGMTKREVDRKLDEIVDFAGVARYLDTPVKRYSSGMKVRLGFAVAAHLEPEILVVDEVLAVGDVEFQKKAIGKMQEVSYQDGRTVLFVSHNMDSILSLTKSCILLQDGHVRMEGLSREVIDNYLQRFMSEVKFEKVYNKNNWKYYPSNNLTKKALLKEIKVLNESSMLRIGESLKLSIMVKSEVASVLKETHIGFRVSNLLDEPACTGFTSEGLEIMPYQKKEFLVEINKLNVPPGNYKFTIWIGRGDNTNKVEDYDSVYDVVAINVFNDISFKWSKVWGKSILPDIKLVD